MQPCDRIFEGGCCKLSLSVANTTSTELIARIATMKKQPSPEKLWKLQHALQVNEMRTSDPVCLYRNCLHHYSQHGKSWISENGDRKRKRCRCRHMIKGSQSTSRDKDEGAKKESNEPDYNDDGHEDQLKEVQQEETGEVATNRFRLIC